MSKSYPSMKKQIWQGVVIGNPTTKKNSQQIFRNKTTGRTFIGQSQKYKEYEQRAIVDLFKIGRPKINKPIEVKCVFYRDSARIVDLVGLLQAIDDILTRANVIEDDNMKIIKSHDGSRVYIDRENPRTEITIFEYEEAENDS